jgi:hypothetical protein
MLRSDEDFAPWNSHVELLLSITTEDPEKAVAFRLSARPTRRPQCSRGAGGLTLPVLEWNEGGSAMTLQGLGVDSSTSKGAGVDSSTSARQTSSLHVFGAPFL